MTLATKYRPRTFDDVVGQEHIITILQNQIKNNDIKKALCFTGGAGTGKTTSARIFAKEIDSEIIEIDGASNNGVDNIRELRESAKFKPINAKHKTFIIDEVHMLSTGAFNALLKILEEPPSHAVFIMCTTDPQKIPATILSRVQRFDFKRMTAHQIQSRLNQIIKWENEKGNNIEVSEHALEYISKLANGGMRDSISLLDTCLGYKKKLDINDIFDILGSAPYDDMFKLTSAILTEDCAVIIDLIEGLHLKGRDLKQFIKSYTEFIVDMNKVKLLGNYDYVSIPSMYFERLDKGMKYIKDNDINLSEWFKKLSALNNLIRYENNPKTLIVGELLCL